MSQTNNESKDAEWKKGVAKRGSQAKYSTDHISGDDYRYPAEVIGQPTKNRHSNHTTNKETGLRKWRFPVFIAYPVQLFQKDIK